MGDYLVTAGTIKNPQLECQTKQSLVNNSILKFQYIILYTKIVKLFKNAA